MRRHLLIVAVVVAFVSGCASADKPGVRTNAVQTDIIFEAQKPASGPIAAPTAAPPTAGGTFSPLTPSPFRNQLPSRFSNVSFGVSEEQAAGDCPDAPIGSAPDHAAPENASAPPQMGLYRYKRRGTETQTINGAEIPSTYSGFDPHVFRDLEKTSDTLWRFTEIEPFGDGVRATVWSVNTHALQRAQSPPYVGENSVRAGEPGRGVALVSITDYDGNGNEVAAFNPSTPVLMLELPVFQGTSWTSVGVDSKTGQSMRFDGEAKKRQSADACGKLLDGWLVSATVTESGGSQPAVTHTDELVFSTDRGGQLLSRRTQQTVQNGTASIESDLTVSIGQIDPSSDSGSNA